MDEKTPSVPQKLWNQALRAVKGDNTQALVEQFTSEMTLVAEGLADDQARLHRDLERLQSVHENDHRQLNDSLSGLETESRDGLDKLREQMKEQDRRLQQLEHAMASLQQQLTARAANKKDRQKTLVQQITLPVALVCATVIIVALLRLF